MSVNFSSGRTINEIFQGANIGSKIRMLRELNGWSQQELADRIGMSKDAVYFWEGKRRSPEQRSIRDLAIAFNIKESELNG